WCVMLLLVVLIGYRLGGWRLGSFVGLLALFVLTTGFLKPAGVSIYFVLLRGLASLLIGVPLRYAGAARRKAREVTNIALDTLQTLPTLVYIIPAVMLFRNGDFSATLAIASYAVAAAVRYAILGFSSVPPERLDAAAMSGATPFQTLKWVRL